MPQLWQGRASKAVDSRVNDFNSSIRFDARTNNITSEDIINEILNAVEVP